MKILSREEAYGIYEKATNFERGPAEWFYDEHYRPALKAMPGLARCLRQALRKAWGKDAFHQYEEVLYVISCLIQAGREGLYAGRRLLAFYYLNQRYRDADFIQRETQISEEDFPNKDGSDLRLYRKPKRFRPVKGPVQPDGFWRFHKRMLRLGAYQAFKEELLRYGR